MAASVPWWRAFVILWSGQFIALTGPAGIEPVVVEPVVPRDRAHADR